MELERRNGLLLSRRWLFKAGAGLAAAGGVSGLLAACGDDDDDAGAGPGAEDRKPSSEGTPVVGDVLDFSLRSDDWEGAFGFVSLRLHRGVVDGDDVWFIRTDASNARFAEREKLVVTPKLEPLADEGLSGELFLLDDGPAVLSSRPGRDDYTPAWRVRRASWSEEPRRLSSVAELRRAARRGELTVDDTGAVMNAAIATRAN